MAVAKMYDLTEVCDLLHISIRSAYGYVQRGTIKAVKIGRKWKVSETELKRLTEGGVQHQKTGPKPRKSE